VRYFFFLSFPGLQAAALVVAVEARVHDDNTASHRRRRSKLREERERDGDKDMQTQQAMWQRKGYCARVQTEEGS
jgi:hypothetical protein